MRAIRIGFLTLALVACGDRLDAPLAGSTGSPAAKTEGPRPSGFLVGCHVDWAEHFTRLETLVDRAELIVGGTVVDITSAASSVRPGMSERRITLRPSWLAKAPRPLVAVTVLETPCPMFDTQVGDEWVVFLHRFWSPSVPRDAGLYVPLGGPQSVFIARGGQFLGPRVPEEAKVPAAYAGRRPSDLQADATAIRPADGDARALFARYGWTVVAPFTIQEVTIPRDFESMRRYDLGRPLAYYSMRSGAIGLDLRPYAGSESEWLTFILEREREPNETRTPPLGYAVIVDRRVVGAWVLVFPQRDAYALNEREAALAAVPRPEPSVTPTPNRFPDGVNLTRRYALANARSVTLRGVDGRSPTTSVADLAAIFDTHLATRDALPPRSGTSWSLSFSFGQTDLEFFHYDPESDTLYHHHDGFAVRPPARFRDLMASVR